MKVEVLSSTKYQPAGKRETGQPLKSLLDCYIESEMSHEALALESVKLMIIRTSSTFRILALLNRTRNSKDKSFLCACCEEIWRSGGRVPSILNLTLVMSGQLHTPVIINLVRSILISHRCVPAVAHNGVTFVFT
jgi:hypothetical protein